MKHFIAIILLASTTAQAQSPYINTRDYSHRPCTVKLEAQYLFPYSAKSGGAFLSISRPIQEFMTIGVGYGLVYLKPNFYEHYYHVGDHVMVPVFIEAQTFPSLKKVFPYADLKTGIVCCASAYVYFNAMMGVGINYEGISNLMFTCGFIYCKEYDNGFVPAVGFSIRF